MYNWIRDSLIFRSKRGETNSLDKAIQWHKSGQLVTFHNRIKLSNGRSEIELTQASSCWGSRSKIITFEELLKYYDRGWRQIETPSEPTSHGYRIIRDHRELKHGEFTKAFDDHNKKKNKHKKIKNKKCYHGINSNPTITSDGKMFTIINLDYERTLQERIKKYSYSFLPPHQVMYLCHGTTHQAADKIFLNGYRESRGGMLGWGVYVGRFRKCVNYTKGDKIFPVVILNAVIMNKIYDWDGKEDPNRIDYLNDTIHAQEGLNVGHWQLRNDEWLVREAKRVIPIGIHVVTEDEIDWR